MDNSDDDFGQGWAIRDDDESDFMHDQLERFRTALGASPEAGAALCLPPPGDSSPEQQAPPPGWLRMGDLSIVINAAFAMGWSARVKYDLGDPRDAPIEYVRRVMGRVSRVSDHRVRQMAEAIARIREVFSRTVGPEGMFWVVQALGADAIFAAACKQHGGSPPRESTAEGVQAFALFMNHWMDALHAESADRSASN